MSSSIKERAFDFVTSVRVPHRLTSYNLLIASFASALPITNNTTAAPAKDAHPPPAAADMRRGGRTLPQAIAHRGYKAEYPENTMDAFRAAVAIGAHAIETDLHLSKDKVVVLSHVRHCPVS